MPIVRSRTIFDRSDTVDIELPSSINSLTNYDLDLLRIAAAHTLTKANAAEVYRRWYGPMTSLARYQLDPFEVWRDAVVRVFLEANLPSHGMAFTAAYDGLETAQASQLRAEEEREETCAGHSNCSVIKADMRTKSSRSQRPPMRPPGCSTRSERLLPFDIRLREVPRVASTSSFFLTPRCFDFSSESTWMNCCSIRSKNAHLHWLF
ncbi:hypothetical protein DXB06_12870 [Butyricicoccus sp. OF13-6]|nr:hypothetical protein DXB06_12870 [Butyricicoccus sp. OF13-6]